MPSLKSLGIFVVVSTVIAALNVAAATVVAPIAPVLALVATLMAPPAARYMRLSAGRIIYWSFVLVSSAVMARYFPDRALIYFITLLLVGLFSDLEQLKIPTFYSAIISVFFASVSFFFILGTWAQNHKTHLVPLLKSHIESSFAKALEAQTIPETVTPEMVLSMMPAIVTFGMMSLVFLSILLVKTQARRERASAFRAPESLIWVFIVSLAGTFLLDMNKAFYAQKVASNVLYICSAIYYFQGLAVVGFFLQKMRVNYIVKAFIFLLIGVHMFVFVAVLGLSDVWFSYRSKWYKKLLKDNPRRDV